MQWNDDENKEYNMGSRRDFISKFAAAVPVLLTATQASAVSEEPTRIELEVDTEYLIRVLNYFDGDMRKVLGVLVRSPQTTVEIDPPKGGDPKAKLTPEDAILRALYSYNSPEDYVTQASWLKVDEPNEGWIDVLTKKRYRIYLPSLGSGGEENGTLEVNIRPTNLNLSNLEAGVALGVLSYPLAYSYYNYESYKEEQAALAKRAKMAAKKAAKAKTAGAKKESKGTPKKEKVDVKAEEGEKQPPAMKGQETKNEVDKPFFVE
ncbi:hypothetical protein ACHAXR_006733 [Thalassiosira sp. AJA248-18]